jgi:dolichyl-phosphate beta-glucosyltransferase
VTAVDVSVVLPVYNGAGFAARHVAELDRFLAGRFAAHEIVVVDDGSTDGTGASLAPLAGDRIRLVPLPRNVGKFGALKAGMQAARGRCRVFTDADLPYELEAIPYIERLVNGRGFHVVTGDRTLAGSASGVEVPRIRAAATATFSFFVRILVTGGLFDTQCGLKGLRGDVAEALFPLLTIDGFAGDVELLYVALKYNLEIRRIPVRLSRRERSTIRLASHVPEMLREILLLRRNWVRGTYESEALRAIAAQDYGRASGSGGTG